MNVINKFKNSNFFTKISVFLAMLLVFFLVLTGMYFGGRYLINAIHKNQVTSKGWIKRHVNLYKDDKVGAYLVDKPSYISIYGDYYQDVIDELISNLEKNDYSVDSPLFKYNFNGYYFS